ncbi:MAG TPA: AarF/UbiB family protein [Longimicrobium sp.]|nr:AarF/UbiB family protein [Longimicrobium sp.]
MSTARARRSRHRRRAHRSGVPHPRAPAPPARADAQPDAALPSATPGDAAAPASPAASGADGAPPPQPQMAIGARVPLLVLARRFATVHRHLLGLAFGAVVARVGALPAERRRGLRALPARAAAWAARRLMDGELAGNPFPAQLRRRLELLGPTYVKLGQIMAIREDLLPRAVCDELKNLFDHLPPVPLAQIERLVELGLGRPLRACFREIDPRPLGSASIAQVHRARTLAGDEVVVKVMKPGIRQAVVLDLRLLRLLGVLLQAVIPRYQPRRIIAEFSAYTLREADFRVEADNAAMFAANFRDDPGIVFPRVYRELSSDTVLTLERMVGLKPGSPELLALPAADRARLIDLGASAIIRMLYRDGFFHADLHAGNLLALSGTPPRVGFIDLGMVGRFEESTRRRMLYYYHALVSGDVEGAAAFLVDMAGVGPGGDPAGFRRAVVDLSRRFYTHAREGEFSVARLILESVGLGGRFRVFFPVEMTLMVKALVTFEGVGRMLDPRLDVAAVSRRHVAAVFKHQFSPGLLARQLFRGAPGLVDVAVRLPQLVVEGVRYAEEAVGRHPPARPLAGVRGAILAGACIVAAVNAMTAGASPFISLALFALAALLGIWVR